MAERVFLSVLNTSLSVSLVILLLTVLAPLIDRRYAAKWKYLAWILLAFRLVLPVDPADVQDFFRNMAPDAAAEDRQSIRELPAPAAAQSARLSRRIVLEMPAGIQEPLTRPDGTVQITPLTALGGIWLTGCALFIGIHLYSCLRYRSLLRREGIRVSAEGVDTQSISIPPAQNREAMRQDHVTLQLLREISGELHLHREIPVIIYAGADSPMVTGFLHPVLVLPAETYSNEALYYILKHELVHFMRYDVYWKLLLLVANAVHWFNPAVWLMRLEAVIDMELSCDERVISGMDRKSKNAYTETLYAMLHQKCTRKHPLSTQFYGGKRIMRKRFRNILMSAVKRNGCSVLAGAAVLMIGTGLLIGCSVSGNDQPGQSTEPVGSTEQYGNSFADSNTAGTAGLVADGGLHMSELPDPAEVEAVKDPAALETALPESMKLTFIMEGESEVQTAYLYAGDGYSIYVPEEGWEEYKSDMWRFVYNDKIGFWVTCYEKQSLEAVKKELGGTYALFPVTESGRENEMEGQIGDIITRARLMEQAEANRVWAVFYSYPEDAIEGAGARLQVITDTFCIQRFGYADLWAFDDAVARAGSNVLQFQNGLQIILPEAWMGKTVLEIAGSEPSATKHDNYDTENRLSVCEKNNAEAHYGGELFHMFYVGKYVNDDFTFDAEHVFSIHGKKAAEMYRVLGTYRQNEQEYALIYAKYPEGDDMDDMNVSPDDPQLRKDYQDLYAQMDDVQIITDRIPGFTKCGVNDLDWIYIEGLSDPE